MIEVRSLSKSFETYERGHSFKDTVKSLFVRKTKLVEAVKDISFAVGKGEIVGFLGPNGAGKSTTLKMLTGILHPTSGEARVLGYVPWRERKRYVARIGAVFGQKSQLLWDIPPLDAFHMNKSIYGIEERVFRQTLDGLVELLGAEGIIRKPTRVLSLGERMKCEFMMAMLHRPEIVFLDEPTIGLDVIAKEQIRDFVREMNRGGTTFILTTHDLDDVDRLAQRAIVINHGAIVFDDSLAALRSRLGTKKQLRVLTAKPLTLPDLPGVEGSMTRSDREAELEVDMAAVELNVVIQWLNERFHIVDMSVQELGIDRVMRELYRA